jgi:hypothetical protein
VAEINGSLVIDGNQLKALKEFSGENEGFI